MMLLKLLFGFAPALLAWTMAASYASPGEYAQDLPEENRRLIERTQERLDGVGRAHDTDIAALREVFSIQQAQISQRLSAIEDYLFWLFVTTGGVGTVVGADKAGYWLRASAEKRRGNNA